MRVYLAFRRLFSIIVGAVFFVAGTLKLMDPVGAGLVVSEYFKFFGVPGLIGASKAVGVALALFETILGAAIVTGIWRRIVAWITLGTLGAFTILTFILYLKNPDMDCGCFGELIHLTHAQSLVKNLVMLVLWAAACFPLKLMQSPKKVKYFTFGLSCIATVLFTVYSLFQIPLVNLTPYKAGARIGFDALMDEVPLSVKTLEGNYLDDCLVDSAKFIVSFYNADAQKVEETLQTLEVAEQYGFLPVVLLSAPTGAPCDSLCLYADRRDILSLNRSNGGATYIYYGNIIRKWSAHSIPDANGLKELSEYDPMKVMFGYSASGRLEFQAYLLAAFAVMLLL